jgi:acetoin utilization deacetylase AcuC-like enzyme
MRTVRVFYSPAYAGSSYAFDTTRKAKWVAESLSSRPIVGIELKEPRPLLEAEVAAVHDPYYVRAVRTGTPRDLAESQGFGWDPGMWPMVTSSNGGAVDAAVEALETGRSASLSSGLHHAYREHGAGYCTFNGLILAAKKAFARGAQAILILDLDAHCGGGTSRLIANDPRIWHVDVAVDDFDRYQPAPPHTLDLIDDAEKYLPIIGRRLKELEQNAPPFDLCLYNAGMDPFEGCPIGGLRGINEHILAEREELVFDWCSTHRVPVAFVLAGGYVGPLMDVARLVELHRLTFAAAVSTA